MKGIKKGVKAALCVLLALVIALGGYLAYVLAAYYRVEDSQECEILFNASVSTMPETGKRYRITSCNIGFGAYSADYSFFMDGGKESRARSADAVVSNTTGSLEAVGSCRSFRFGAVEQRHVEIAVAIASPAPVDVVEACAVGTVAHEGMSSLFKRLAAEYYGASAF